MTQNQYPAGDELDGAPKRAPRFEEAFRPLAVGVAEASAPFEKAPADARLALAFASTARGLAVWYALTIVAAAVGGCPECGLGPCGCRCER